MLINRTFLNIRIGFFFSLAFSFIIFLQSLLLLISPFFETHFSLFCHIFLSFTFPFDIYLFLQFFPITIIHFPFFIIIISHFHRFLFFVIFCIVIFIFLFNRTSLFCQFLYFSSFTNSFFFSSLLISFFINSSFSIPLSIFSPLLQSYQFLLFFSFIFSSLST